jgi:hypothetical protein
MSATSCRLLLICTAASAALIVACSSSVAQIKQSGEVERILADWQKRQEQIKRIKYTISGEWITPKGSWTGTPGSRPGVDPPADIVQPQRFVVILDLEKRRLREESAERVFAYGAQEMQDRACTYTYDGKDLWRLYPRPGVNPHMRETDPDLEIGRGAPSKTMLMGCQATCGPAVLFGSGLIWLVKGGADYGQVLDADDFRVHGHAIYEGRPCTILRTFPMTPTVSKPFDEFWVDTSRQSAIVRYVFYKNFGKDNILDSETNITYQQTAHGWLPLRWKDVFYGLNGPGPINRRQVDEVIVDPPLSDADFQLQPQPGMIVSEFEMGTAENGRSTRANEKHFRVSEEGRLIAIVNGRELPNQRWTMLWLSAFLAAGVLIVLLVWLAWKKWSQRRKLAASP